jgi:20S proteasome subunit beta 3
MQYNGSGMIAMTGKNCVAICSDTRLGIQQVTVATDFQRIFKMHDKLFMGLPGLATDVLTLYVSLFFCSFLFWFLVSSFVG